MVRLESKALDGMLCRLIRFEVFFFFARGEKQNGGSDCHCTFEILIPCSDVFRVFRIMDDDGSRALDFNEFKKGVRDYGLILEPKVIEIRWLQFHFQNNLTSFINNNQMS